MNRQAQQLGSPTEVGSKSEGAPNRIEPARLQFVERLLADMRLGAGEPLKQVLIWAHDRLFLDGASVSTVRAELLKRGRSTRTIAIASGKGGVGKTTVSVNLAVAFANLGLRVLLFDADLGMANVHVFAGVTPSGTLLDVIDGRRRLDEVVIAGPGGVRLICGASGVARMADLNAGIREGLGRELLHVAADFDVLLMDAGAGISPAVTHFVSLVEEAIVVSTPNVAATLDAYGLIKVVHESSFKTRLHLLVNLADTERQARAVQDRIAGCAMRFLQRGVHDAGFLLRDPGVEQANQCRRPLFLDQPGHPNLQCLSRIASALAGTASDASPVKSHVAA